MTTSVTQSFPYLLDAFFTRLRAEMNASPHTIDSYRYAMRLLLQYATDKLRKAHTDLLVEDLDADQVVAFILHLEEERNNSIQTRNIRLAAIKGVFDYIGRREPELMLTRGTSFRDESTI